MSYSKNCHNCRSCAVDIRICDCNKYNCNKCNCKKPLNIGNTDTIMIFPFPQSPPSFTFYDAAYYFWAPNLYGVSEQNKIKTQLIIDSIIFDVGIELQVFNETTNSIIINYQITNTTPQFINLIMPINPCKIIFKIRNLSNIGNFGTINTLQLFISTNL